METRKQEQSDWSSGVELVRREDAGAVAVLTMNRPEKRNALSEAMIGALSEALQKAATDRSIGALVLTGAGSCFSSGHDLKELSGHRAGGDRGRAAFIRILTACSGLMMQIVHLPKPVIAAVNGVATAAGCQLVASCDLAIASSEARFATPGVNIGLFCSTPMVALSRNVPRKAAMEMLLTGETIGAAEAERIGLINRSAPGQDFLGEAVALAARIADKPRATVKTGKEAFYRQAEMPLKEAYDYASKVMVENMLHAEAVEGIGAFLEKRKPEWPSGE